jgi:hypothetical protein
MTDGQHRATSRAPITEISQLGRAQTRVCGRAGVGPTLLGWRSEPPDVQRALLWLLSVSADLRAQQDRGSARGTSAGVGPGERGLGRLTRRGGRGLRAGGLGAQRNRWLTGPPPTAISSGERRRGGQARDATHRSHSWLGYFLVLPVWRNSTGVRDGTDRLPGDRADSWRTAPAVRIRAPHGSCGPPLSQRVRFVIAAGLAPVLSPWAGPCPSVTPAPGAERRRGALEVRAVSVARGGWAAGGLGAMGWPGVRDGARDAATGSPAARAASGRAATVSPPVGRVVLVSPGRGAWDALAPRRSAAGALVRVAVCPDAGSEQPAARWSGWAG